MSELNRLLRQAARITAGVSPNTETAKGDHEGDASYVTALAGEKKASRKKADEDPNTPRAEEDHKGDAAYETALDSKNASTKKAEFGQEEAPAEAEAPSENPFAAEEEAPSEDAGVTNADMVQALEDMKQELHDTAESIGSDPAADLLQSLEDVIGAVETMQNAVSEDAMLDPAAKTAFKTASAFKEYFIRERNIMAAKVIRQKLASYEASKKEAKKATPAPTKRAFDPKTLRK